MFSVSLKTRVIVSFILVILVLSLSISLLGYYVIQEDILDRAQEQVENDLRAARFFYNLEIQNIGQELRIASFEENVQELEEKLNLDYAEVIGKDQLQKTDSSIVRRVFDTTEGVGGTRLIAMDELKWLAPETVDRVKIQIKETKMARPTEKEVLEKALAKEYAIPYEIDNGEVTKVLFGGKIINQDYDLVDRIRSLVFGTETYTGKPIGTVTIFQLDTRIATNVLNKQGQRAIGTRVSEVVYNKVIGEGQTWRDRAFVVTEWYKTAYEPVRNIDDEVIGILYVGILEAPFNAMAREIIVFFLFIVIGATLLAVLLAVVLANAVSKPLTQILDGTKRLTGGELGYSVNTDLGVSELNELAKSFNVMSAKLHERDASLKISNDKLKQLNKSYVELIGFVAHELKGILASAIMNAYAVKDGYLGMVNFKQAKAIDSVTRNLEYLSATVKKFLNLGRIERGDLEIHKQEFRLKEDVFERALESLEAIRKREDIKIINKLQKDLKVNADHDLMMIVANNLLSNALKYGNAGGEIRLESNIKDSMVQVDIYNDSKPIPQEQIDKLFKKFSRLQSPETKKVKGTGLGLYITRQIIEKHGGKIWVEPKDKGNSFIFVIERGM